MLSFPVSCAVSVEGLVSGLLFGNQVLETTTGKGLADHLATGGIVVVSKLGELSYLLRLSLWLRLFERLSSMLDELRLLPTSRIFLTFNRRSTDRFGIKVVGGFEVVYLFKLCFLV